MTNANEVEAFQSFCRKFINKKIKEHFSDIGLAENELYNSASGRLAARNICLHKDNDPIGLTVARMIAFYLIMNEKDEVNYEPEIKGSSRLRAYKPIITLFFIQKATDVEPGYKRVEGKISFRLMNESTESLTNTKLIQYARKIKNIFTKGEGYRWRKGRTMFTYADWEKGYQLQLLCRDESTAKDLIAKILDIQSDSPDWKHLYTNQNNRPDEAYPKIPKKVKILGKQVRQGRHRPVSDVYFREASIKIEGLQNKIVLYNRLNNQPKAVLRD
ncbi:MAG: hypothetical protein QNJ51_03035 [Calothrix sp. MO_167.B12]|nr:hypothetical protein [Calothrix sp. MO_167.B12]